jgi:hypothetical protein
MALRCRSEGFFWTHGMHAVAYSALGMREEASAAVQRLIGAYPDFPRKAPEELALWMSPERGGRMLAALRGAGLEIPTDAAGKGPPPGAKSTRRKAPERIVR